MEQKKILIMMAAAYGHLNCTFPLANRLKKEGYQITYATQPSMQKYLEEQGFQTVLCDPYLFTAGNEATFSEATKMEQFLHRLADRLSGLRLQYTLDAAKEMNAAIKSIEPDLLLLDSFYPFNYFFIEGKKPPTILLQIMLATRRRAGIPTLNSGLQPAKKTGKFRTTAVYWSWRKYLLKTWWERIIMLGDHPLQVTYRIFKKQKKSIKSQLDHSVVFRPGIRGLQEWILGPKAIDFDDISTVQQLYLASSVHAQRKEKVPDLKLSLLLEQLRESHQKKIWIFCSLGTLNIKHNKNCINFYKQVLRVFAERPDWELILTTGAVNPFYFGPQPPNVHLFARVPQLEILKYSRVMITHGGVNSMLECIDELKPMLVYPLNNTWDQNGNSARIVHYGLGLRGTFNKITAAEIIQKLEELLRSPSYLENLQQMRKRISAEEGLEKAVELIKKKIPLQQLSPVF